MKKEVSKKNSSPVLTILIPVYNTQDYIKKCLESLISKEVEDMVEVIIVSDGSKDNSISIAKTITDNHKKMFSIIEKENGGHGSTINVGIKKAKGKYFRVLDSDDWFDTEEFVKFVRQLEKCDSDMVITDYSKEFVNDGISETIKYNNLKDSTEYSFEDFNLKLLDNQFFAMATITYKTKILKDIKFQLPEKTFYVDMLYDVIPVLNVNTFTYYADDIYKYYIGRAGQSVNTNSYVKNHENHYRVTTKLIEFYSEKCQKIPEIKKEYFKSIINAVINTNYAIYCLFFRKKHMGYNYIKQFDSYLKDKSEELYNDTNKSAIKLFRCFRFLIVLIIPRFIKMYFYKKSIKKNKGGN